MLELVGTGQVGELWYVLSHSIGTGEKLILRVSTAKAWKDYRKSMGLPPDPENDRVPDIPVGLRVRRRSLRTPLISTEFLVLLRHRIWELLAMSILSYK